MKDFIKRADLILLAIILALSVLGFVVLRRSSGENSVVVISVGGKTVASYSLNDDASLRVFDDGSVKDVSAFAKAISDTFETEAMMESEALGAGYNDIEIKDGCVWVLEANCPNGDCKRFGKISKEGQVILCLPHKLAVTISGGEAQSDAISY